MTTIASQPFFPPVASLPKTANVPKLSDFAGQGESIGFTSDVQAALDERVSSEAANTGKTEGQLREERATAKALEKIERIQALLELSQEEVKKESIIKIKKINEDMLKRVEESLSKPAEEAEELSGAEAASIRKVAEEMFRAAGYDHFFSNPGSVIFGLDGWQYNFYKDGRVTRKKQGILTPDQVQPAREQASALKAKLLGEHYEAQIQQSQKRIDELFQQLGILSDQEKEFLGGFGILANANISLTA